VQSELRGGFDGYLVKTGPTIFTTSQTAALRQASLVLTIQKRRQFDYIFVLLYRTCPLCNLKRRI